MSGERILVVDDSPTDLTLMTMPLRENGFQVVTAVDGDEAVEMALKDRPRVIVLDVIMPKKNGFQVCRTLKNLPESKDIPVILLTSKNQESDKFWGMKQGADEYLTKPFEGKTLVEAVKRHL